MSRKIVSILALLCFLAISNCAIAAQENWAPPNPPNDPNWFNTANWGGAVPTSADWACVQPGFVQPIIDGAAVANPLSIEPWSGGGLSSVDMNTGTLDFGSALNCAAEGTFDTSAQGFSPGILYVYGGTITTSASGSNGLVIGGLYAPNAGRVIMYGGLINTPRIALQHGDIALYGGTLELQNSAGDSSADANFIFSQAFQGNKIDISGGTLQFAGDYRSMDPCFPSLISNGRIYSSRGTLGTPVYAGNTTTLSCTGSVNMDIPWGPSPANNATNVHYRTGDVNTGITLQWNSGDEPNVINHDVYFGTSSATVTAATQASTGIYMGEVNEANLIDGNNAEPNSFVVGDVNGLHPYNFKLNTTYYWRVDDNQITVTYDSGGNPISSYTTLIQGPTWKFTTHDGKAYNPKPYNGRVGLTEPLALSWTPGDFTNTQMVFVGTDSTSITNATSTTAKVYRTTLSRTTSSYSLTGLGTNWYGPLVASNTYYWKVTEANGTTTWGGAGLGGAPNVWAFTPTTIITIENFEDYNSTADINANWSTGYTTCGIDLSDNVTVPPVLSYVFDAAGRHGKFYYNNYMANGGPPFSEERRSYSNVTGGTIFTGNTNVLSSQPKALRVDYFGAATNAADPIYDRMYVAIEDTTGNIGVVYNPDGNAALVTQWTSWYIALTDANFSAPLATPGSVNLAQVNNFYVGFGQRCVEIQSYGRDGNVMFDNIGLYGPTCNASVADLTITADLDGDCDVDISDLAVFANSWLQKAQVLTLTITAPQTPVLWYKFNNSAGASVTDYGKTGSYTGTVTNLGTRTWNTTGGRNGGRCIYLPSGGNSYVSCSTSALSFMSDANHSGADGGGITFSAWINADATAFTNVVEGLIRVDATDGNSMYICCPRHAGYPNATDWGNPWAEWAKSGTSSFGFGPGEVPADFFGRWNHWAWVKTPDTVSWYCNGNLIKQEADTDANASDPNIYGPLFHLPVSTFTIALGNGWGGNWVGYIADFQVYDYALNANEVGYLASDGAGQVVTPLDAADQKADLYVNEGESNPSAGDANQTVDFKDLSVMGNQWHTIIMWP